MGRSLQAGIEISVGVTRMHDLFSKLRKLTDQEENLFTECLAETLRSDPQLLRQFVKRLCGQVAGRTHASRGSIEVRTQVDLNGSILDMIFCVSEALAIGVENKLHSPEGKERDGKTQLEKYIGLVHAGKLSHLAFITGYHTDAPTRVAGNKGYLRPCEQGKKMRDHFMWTDFYPMIERRASKAPASLAPYLLSLLIDLGFKPPSPEIGDLNDPDEEVARRNKTNFANFWERTKQALRKRGWETTHIDKAGLWVEGGKAKRLKITDINPCYNRGNLRFNLTLKNGVKTQAVAGGLMGMGRHYGAGFSARPAFTSRTVAGRRRKVAIVKVLYPLSKLVENRKKIPERLEDLVLAVVDKVG
jgi:hypothetical protein